jgi:hypothetical protein
MQSHCVFLCLLHVLAMYPMVYCEYPLHLVTADITNNGTLTPLLVHYNKGSLYNVADRG